MGTNLFLKECRTCNTREQFDHNVFLCRRCGDRLIDLVLVPVDLLELVMKNLRHSKKCEQRGLIDPVEPCSCAHHKIRPRIKKILKEAKGG